MEKKEFLFNGDFNVFSEQNGFDGWVWTAEGDYVMSRAEGRNGKNAIAVDYVGHTSPHSVLNLTNTNEQRLALAKEVKQNGLGIYQLSCYFKAADEQSVGKKIRIKAHYIYKNKEGEQVGRVDVFSQPIEIGTEWVIDKKEFAVHPIYDKEDQELYYIAIEFVVANNEKINVLISDISFTCKELITKETLRKPKKVIPFERTQIGVIRWDIWEKSDSAYESNEKIAQNEALNKQNGTTTVTVPPIDLLMRTLSYYPERAPYFVDYEGEQENGDVKLSIKSCYEKTGLTYQKEDVMDDLKVKEHPYNYGVSWEEEAKMALDAGIDYFAYLYKGINNTRPGQVLEPAIAHTAKNGMLEDGRQLKMICIMQDNPAPLIDIDTLETDEEKLNAIIYPRRMMYQAMAQSCYLNVRTPDGEIPIMHFFIAESNRMTPERAEIFKKEARFYTRYLHKKNPDKYREVDDIYLVVQHFDRRCLGVRASAYRFNFAGVDALSKYAVNPYVSDKEREYVLECVKKSGKYDDLTVEHKNVKVEGTNVEWQYLNRIQECYDTKPSKFVNAFGEDYEHYIDRIDEINDLYRECQEVIKYVPTVSLTHNALPRIKTRIWWCGDYNYEYVKTGTGKQQAEQLRRALEYTNKYSADFEDSTNTLYMYAWNEFDEGGSLQPTLLIGEDGKPVKNADGTNKMNTDVIDECAKVIAEYRKKERLIKK